ncbi:MAG: urease accessory protein UreD [Ottowia sp.]|uniref:urease accessory protein UreD n=1 Tax=Ottowia sp. TaxID=1898956 RepID=UPI0039E2D379
MTWNATLDIRYAPAEGRTVARHRHEGPLRVLKSLYPESPRVCHNVLVHPPGGIAGGDRLDVTVHVDGGAHGLISTPGATRFYRSDGLPAVQDVRLHLAEGARLEWLPLETLVYPGARAENRLALALAPGAALMGWDVVGLGLPHAGQPFERGWLAQRIEWPGVWLEQARIDAADARLLGSPLGLAGQRCVATLFYASGSPLARAGREQALELTREVLDAHPLAAQCGATVLDDRLLVVRALAPVTEPAVGLLRQVWAVWRGHFWSMPAVPPRIWAM